MRLLVVTHAYPRWDGDVAGAFIERLCLALAARGHRIAVLAPSDAGRGGSDERGGIRVQRVRYGSAAAEVLAYRGTMPEAARSLAGLRTFARLVTAFRDGIVDHVKRGGVDLVHSHWWLPAGIGAWRAARTVGVPYVVTLHGTDVALLRRSRVARAVGRRVLRRAAGITAVSRFLAAEAAQACGVREADVVVQPMPADALLLDPDRPGRPDRGTGRMRLVTVGRLIPQKRYGLFLDAVRELQQRGIAVQATIVGEGPDRGALERDAARFGITHCVRFAGAVPPGEVGSFLDDAQVFVFPARGEGFGLAVAEALMHELPVVACTDGGGVTEIVPPEGGRLVAPQSGALADAIQALAAEPGAPHAARDAGARWRDSLRPSAGAAIFERAFSAVLATGR